MAVWTKAEEKFLRRVAGLMYDEQVAAALTRLRGEPVSVCQVRNKRQELGIQKLHGPGVCAVVGGRDAALESEEKPAAKKRGTKKPKKAKRREAGGEK